MRTPNARAHPDNNLPLHQQLGTPSNNSPGSAVIAFMDQRKVVLGVLEKAKRYRSFVGWISDEETAQRISELADELKGRARALANPSDDRIRSRAREIWDENGRPSGRDEEFWLQAEREFREAEDLAKADDLP